ncbi:MAG: 50S ribosomal protein L18 [Bdellovibrionota bacterium]|nr:50S ribosomal protein L18 [Deltaproteobacteria bacterium]
MKKANITKENRKNRVRKSVKANKDLLRLTVFRSNKHIYAQIIDDKTSSTVASASTVGKNVSIKKTSDMEAAAHVGEMIAKKALDAKVEKVCFDRGGYLYHGRVKALADAARKHGLKF